MRKIIFLILGTFGLIFMSKAQVSSTTDRPGQAISARILKIESLQFATGAEFQNWKNTLSDNSQFASSLLDNVLRYGISQNSEIGFGLQAYSNQSKINDSIFSTRGVGRLSLKFRNGFLLKKSRFKALAYEIDLGIPILNEVSNNKYFSPKFTFSSEFKVSEKINTVFNLGMLWDGISAEQIHFYVVNVNYSLDNSWSLFAEYYANHQNGNYDGKWDAGVSYLKNNLTQIDLSGGYDRNNSGQYQWFAAIGVSWLKPHSRDILD